MDAKLFGFDARGNVGLQLVNTDQSGAGYYVNEKTCTEQIPPNLPVHPRVRRHQLRRRAAQHEPDAGRGRESVVRVGVGPVDDAPAWPT